MLHPSGHASTPDSARITHRNRLEGYVVNGGLFSIVFVSFAPKLKSDRPGAACRNLTAEIPYFGSRVSRDYFPNRDNAENALPQFAPDRGFYAGI